MLRVLHVIWPLNLGGAETVVMNYYRNIDRTKIQFDFLIAEDEQKEHYYDKEALSLGARIFRRPLRTKHPIKNARALFRIFKENPDIRIIHVHSSVSMLPATDLFLSRLRGVKVRIAHSHTERPKRSFAHRLFTPLLKFSATDWFGCSGGAGRYMFGKAWDRSNKSMVLPNAIDAKKLRFDVDKRQIIRNELGLGDRMTVIHVANFGIPKNHSFLLEVIAKVRQINPEVVFLLVGGGKRKDEIQAKAAEFGDSVRFLGIRDDISDLLQAADLFVLPSLREGLGMAAIEAQAAGLPCLLSANIPAEVKITESAEFLPITDASCWAERIIALQNFERCDTFEAIERSGYDIRRAAENLEAFYFATLDRGNK